MLKADDLTYQRWAMIDEEKLIAKFHETFGVCGTCHKAKCTGRKSYSVLPKTLSSDEVLSIIKSLKVDEGTVETSLDERRDRNNSST